MRKRPGNGSGTRRLTVRPGTTLGQSLKLAGLVATGGEAKARIDAGEVRVNGIVEERRGRKMKAGDRIEIGGHVIVLQLTPDDSGAGSTD